MVQTDFLAKLLLYAVFSLVLTACGGGSDDDEEDSGGGDPIGEDWEDPFDEEIPSLADTIHHLGVDGAQGFVITDRSEANETLPPNFSRIDASASFAVNARSLSNTDSDAAGMEPGTLYKATDTGALEPVPFNDEEGNQIEGSSVTPLSVIEIGPDFVYVAVETSVTVGEGEMSWTERETAGLLVNKDTGLAFLADEAFGDHYNVTENPRQFSNNIRLDDRGNIYLLKNVHPVKIDISNLGQGDLTAQTLVDLHQVYEFELAQDGNAMLYEGWDEVDSNDAYMAYDVLNEQLHTIRSLPGNSQDDDPTSYVRGLDGELYLPYNPPYTPEHPLYKLSRNENGELEMENLGMLDGIFASGAPNGEEEYGTNDVLHGFSDIRTSSRKVVNGRLIYLSDYFYQPFVYEVDLPNRTVIGHDEFKDLFDSNKSFDIRTTDRFVWIKGSADSGSPLVVRYNPATREVRQLTFDDNLRLNSFEPMGDKILFEALRYEDQATLVGEMSVEGDQLITEVYQAAPTPILTLQAIMPSDFVHVDGNPNDWKPDSAVFEGTADGPQGSDLVGYSDSGGRNEYLGLVTFDGDIDRNPITRIALDTHEVIINGSELGIRPKGDSGALTDVLAKGGVLAYGQSSIEFSIPQDLLGTNQPGVLSVERYEAATPDDTLDILED